MAVRAFWSIAMLAAGLTGLPGAPAVPSASVETTNSSAWSVNIEADLASRYVWRGLALSKGLVVQPAVSLSACGFTLCWWNNYDLGEKTTPRRWNETDMTLTYEREVGPLKVELGVQSYLYPSPTPCPNTAETLIQVGYAVGPLTFLTRHSSDLAAYAGSYFGEAGLEWEHDLHQRLLLEACALVGWASSRFNEAYVGSSGGAVHQAAVEIALVWKLTQHLALRPHVGLSGLLAGRGRRAVDEPDLVWGGLAASFAF